MISKKIHQGNVLQRPRKTRIRDWIYLLMNCTQIIARDETEWRLDNKVIGPPKDSKIYDLQWYRNPILNFFMPIKQTQNLYISSIEHLMNHMFECDYSTIHPAFSSLCLFPLPQRLLQLRISFFKPKFPFLNLSNCYTRTQR